MHATRNKRLFVPNWQAKLGLTQTTCQTIHFAAMLVLAVCPTISGQSKGDEAVPPPVIVDTVVEKSVNSGYRVVGSVQPLRTSMIGVAVGGRVEKFLVDVGHRVKEGQILAELRTGTLQIEKAAAEAELELYKQQLAEVVNGSRPEEIAEAEANLQGAKAAMEIAASQLKRLEQIAVSGAATQTDLEDARERASRTRFAYNASKALYARIAAGSRTEQIAASKAQVSLQTQRLKLIEDRIRLHSLRAPFNGFVSQEFTEVGAWISSGDPVVEIIQMDTVEVQAPITADYAVKLNVGETVRVDFSQLPNRLFTGTVDRIVPKADPRARTFPIFVRLENEFRGDLPLLLSGMLARVDLPAGSARSLPLVPKDALVLANGKREVFVVEPDKDNPKYGVVKRVPVELGVAMEEMIQVNAKLRAGQPVVVVGNERLADGDRVALVFRGEE
ncbi:MAG: efflux RND transporter periplasmic adaptor subunit [Planctomycetota bacterium]